MYSKEEARQLRKEFWIAFSNYTKFYSKQVGEPIDWMLYKTGIKGLELKFEIEDRYVLVMIEVNASSEDKRFDMYLELDKYKVIVKNAFGDELEWEECYKLHEGKEVSRIYVELANVKYYNVDNWPNIFQFMASNMYKLQSNFLEIHDILKERFGNSIVL